MERNGKEARLTSVPAYSESGGRLIGSTCGWVVSVLQKRTIEVAGNLPPRAGSEGSGRCAKLVWRCGWSRSRPRIRDGRALSRSARRLWGDQRDAAWAPLYLASWSVRARLMVAWWWTGGLLRGSDAGGFAAGHGMHTDWDTEVELARMESGRKTPF